MATHNAFGKWGEEIACQFLTQKGYSITQKNYRFRKGEIDIIAQKAEDAPKYRALMYFQKKNRCWWHACWQAGHVARKSKPKHNPGAYVMNRRFKPGTPTQAKAPTTNVVKFDTSVNEAPLVQRAGWSNPTNDESQAIQSLFNDPAAPNAWE